MLRAVALALLVLAAGNTVAQPAADAAPPALRLPSGARPLAYDLQLAIVPGAPDARGTMAIDVELDRPHALVWLHANGVEVRDATSDVPGTRVSALGRGEFLGLAFDPPLPAGRHRLTLPFRAEQRRAGTQGLFTIQQRGDWYTMTHFEPLSARRAFPCFDEPSFKVPWTIALTVPREQVAVGNTPVASIEDAADGMKTVRFATTRPLPSYLVAFAVGPWSFVDAGEAGLRPTPLRIVVPRGREREAAFAASAYRELFGLTEDWFGIPHPYPKLDHIAIPVDAGFAMENAGLITYGQPILLAEPDAAVARFRRVSASVGTHEIAHQWFGDLVTMAWWDDLWLNESFADWFTVKTVERWKPAWGKSARRSFERADAMAADARASARRIREPIATSGDIRNAFDAITYKKGATVIGMFERWIGEETFRRAVQRYLDAHRDGNATADDFLRALDAGSGRPVAAPFSTFLDQNGVPAVSVELSCGRAGSALTLAQKRYVPLGTKAAGERRWEIPVCVRYDAKGRTREACTLLADERATVPLEGCPTFVAANAGGAGYYLPLYRGDLLARLAAKRAALSIAERTSTLLDLRLAVAANETAAAQALAWVADGAGSADTAVVTAAADVAAWMRGTVVAPDDEAAFTRFAVSAFGPRMRALGLSPRKGESEDDELLRRSLLRFVGADDPATAREAARLARAWLDEPSSLDPASVEPVLVVAARAGDAPLFDAMLARATETPDPARRRHLLLALFSFRDPALALRGRALLLDDRFDARDTSGAHGSGLRDAADRQTSLAFYDANFDAIAKRSSPDSPTWWPWMADGLCGDASYATVTAFWRERAARYPGADRNVAQVLEGIASCTAVRAAQQASARAFLATR